VSACPHGAVRFHPMIQRVIRCDLCDGDPACIKVCEPKAIQFVDSDVAESRKRRSAAIKISCGI
jgi:Fe-S-cluster-containing hydrogenase component 2